MKRLQNIKHLFLFALAIVFISSCGGSGSVSSNEYLAKLPGLAQKYHEEITELEKELKENTDMEDDFKLRKELELKEEEAEKAIETYYEEHKAEIKPLPFEEKDDERYSIEEIKVSGATYDQLNIKAKVKVNEELRGKYGSRTKTIFLYLMFYDSKGEPLGEWGVCASSFGNRDGFEIGKSYEMNGIIRGLHNTGDFAKVIAHDREYYNENK